MDAPKRTMAPVRKPVVEDDEVKIRKRMLVLNRKMKDGGLDKQGIADNANEWMQLNAKLKDKK